MSSLSYCQNNDKEEFNKIDLEFEAFYEKEDTLYFYFKNSKHEKTYGLNLISPPNLKSIDYYYNFSEDKHYYRLEYLNQDLKKEKAILKILKSKSFLRHNKKKIITYCELRKLSLKTIESFYWNNRNKIIYLIDKSENVKGEITLRKVSFYSSYYHKL